MAQRQPSRPRLGLHVGTAPAGDETQIADCTNIRCSHPTTRCTACGYVDCAVHIAAGCPRCEAFAARGERAARLTGRAEDGAPVLSRTFGNAAIEVTFVFDEKQAAPRGASRRGLDPTRGGGRVSHG